MIPVQVCLVGQGPVSDDHFGVSRWRQRQKRQHPARSRGATLLNHELAEQFQYLSHTAASPAYDWQMKDCIPPPPVSRSLHLIPPSSWKHPLRPFPPRAARGGRNIGWCYTSERVSGGYHNCWNSAFYSPRNYDRGPAAAVSGRACAARARAVTRSLTWVVIMCVYHMVYVYQRPCHTPVLTMLFHFNFLT